MSGTHAVDAATHYIFTGTNRFWPNNSARTHTSPTHTHDALVQALFDLRRHENPEMYHAAPGSALPPPVTRSWRRMLWRAHYPLTPTP